MGNTSSESPPPPDTSANSQVSLDAGAAALSPQPQGRSRTYAGVLGVLFFLYLFLVSIKAMGGGLKTYAKDPGNEQRIHALFHYADNPFVGLAAGILLTSLVQSSSFTTSFIIALVAAGQLSTSQAVPAIMGANIGTSVTNTLVSLAHWRSQHEFRTAFAAATVHDIFNFLTVLILLPLELRFGFLSKLASWSAGMFNLPDDIEIGKGLITAVTEPLINQLDHFLTNVLMLSSGMAGLSLSVIGIILLFVSLIMLVRLLKGLMLGRLEALFRRFFFSNTIIALIVGLIVTVMVQSSSVTTSLIIPFVGAGLLTLRQVFPYMVGANIGTTCTGLLAAAAAPTSGSLMVAFVHLLFNVIGASIFIPLRRIPITLSHRLAKYVARNRALALVYIASIFVIAPIACIYLFSLLAAE